MSSKFESSFFAKICDLDSFYDSKILIYTTTLKLSNKINTILSTYEFNYIKITDNLLDFFTYSKQIKYDLIIFNLENKLFKKNTNKIIEKLRLHNTDSAIITIGKKAINPGFLLKNSINTHLSPKSISANLVKAVKKSLGEKKSYETGMQFFDALFGMQMSTHKEVHQSTFDHVIRTTKIYSKFLIYLEKKKYINLTSWALKNCLMASLVHDLGKLMVMPDVLYKDGGLSDFEFQQIRRHPWNSISALLGRQDLSFFTNKNSSTNNISGYNEKNLGEQVKKWINEKNKLENSTMQEIDSFFEEMRKRPFVHSLNKDILYIVFRHHDGINSSYHTDEELKLFSEILGSEIQEKMSSHSLLDVVTNSLSLCDMYDALMDTQRDYRKTKYNKLFVLFLLYSEMMKSKFFKPLFKEFVKFIVEDNTDYSTCFAFGGQNSETVYKLIEGLYNNFRIPKDQEIYFNDFLATYYKNIKQHLENSDKNSLRKLNDRWITFYENERKKLLEKFIGELAKYALVNKKIEEFTIDEIKAFDMLYKFYYSYNSELMQKKVIRYFVKSVVKPILTDSVKNRMIEVIRDENINDWNQLNKAFVEKAYNKRDLLNYFANLNEEALLYDFNEFLKKY